MEVVDIWDTDARDGHIPGAWDCPCGPWVRTYADESPQVRTVRHVNQEAQ